MILSFNGGPRDGEERSIKGIPPMQFRFPKSGYLAANPARLIAVVDIYYLRLRRPDETRDKEFYDWRGQVEDFI